jgi:ATP-dependent RNA helicase RhlE
MPPAIEALTREMLRNPTRVALQRKAAPTESLSQALYPVAAAGKSALLLELLCRNHMNEALVFTRTKHRADRLARLLNQSGIRSDRIHGNRSQAQRTRVLSGFKSGEIRVLVATDLMARGIDVDALGHVVNFDVPAVPEDYIHRVGRTARAEARGEAFTLVAPEDEPDVARIERALGKALPRVRLEGFAYETNAAPPLEIPRGERLAAMRAKKAGDRARAAAKTSAGSAGRTSPPDQRPPSRRPRRRPFRGRK